MDSEPTDLDVRSQRKEFLENLKKKVDDAYTNRRKLNLIPLATGRYTYEENKRHESEVASKISEGLQSKTPIELNGKEKGLNQVVVSNSHDYRDLLILAYERVGFVRDEIPTLVDNDLRHEYMHMVPVIGYDNIFLEYSVEFFEDLITHSFGVKPAVLLSTKPGTSISYDLAKKFFAGPDDPSSGDTKILSAFKLPLSLRMLKAIGRKPPTVKK